MSPSNGVRAVARTEPQSPEPTRSFDAAPRNSMAVSKSASTFGQRNPGSISM